MIVETMTTVVVIESKCGIVVHKYVIVVNK